MSTPLEGLLADGVIDAIIGQLKSGKEAEVWLVEHQGEIVAAKIYKERHARNFRNNAGYREGREVRSSRTARAMAKGSRFGVAAAEEAWRSAEVDALYALHAAGVRVPAPVVFYEGVLLMELVIDPGGHPAPRLIETPPASAAEAEALYEDLRTQVIRMLSVDLVHGDLSAYNILSAWNGPTLIDFPQTIAAAKNTSAERYFKRDMDGVRVYLAGFAPSLFDRDWETDDIWRAYLKRELSPEYVPNPANRQSRLVEAGRRGPKRGAAGVRPTAPSSGPVQATHFDRSAFAAPEAAPVVPIAAPGETDEEAELRALEATLLRQGGGSRGKPPGASKDDAAQGRRGGRGGPRSGSGPRTGGGNRSGGSGPRGGAARPQGAQNASGPRQGPAAVAVSGRAQGPRDGGGAPRDVSGSPRNDRGPQRDGTGGQRDVSGGPRSDRGAQRDGGGGQRDVSGGPRSDRGAQRDGGSTQESRGFYGNTSTERRPPRDGGSTQESRGFYGNTGSARGVPRDGGDGQRTVSGNRDRGGPRDGGGAQPTRGDSGNVRRDGGASRDGGAPRDVSGSARSDRGGPRDGGAPRDVSGSARSDRGGASRDGGAPRDFSGSARSDRGGAPREGGAPRDVSGSARGDRGGPRSDRDLAEGRAPHSREMGGRGASREFRSQGPRDGGARTQERRDGGGRGGGNQEGARRDEGRGGPRQNQGPAVSFVPRRPSGDPT